MSSKQLIALDNNIFAMMTKLKRNVKRAYVNSIHPQIIKTDFEEMTEGNFQERINHFISDSKVIKKTKTRAPLE